MQYWLKISLHNTSISINFKDKQASRGATMAGLLQTDVDIEAWDIDEQGRRWDKEV